MFTEIFYLVVILTTKILLIDMENGDNTNVIEIGENLTKDKYDILWKELFLILNVSNLFTVKPSFNIMNSSWSHTFSFTKADSGYWKLNLTLSDVHKENLFGPHEHFDYSILSGTTRLAFGSLLILVTEPLYHWKLGENELSSAFVSSNKTFRLHTRPCNRKLIVSFFQDGSQLILGFSWTLFLSSSLWYTLDFMSYIPQCNASATACPDARLLDAQLTNYHIMILTNYGLLVSDILEEPPEDPQLGYNFIDFNTTMQLPLSEGRLRYVPVCQWRVHDPAQQDVMAVVIADGNKARFVFYSVEPFLNWTRDLRIHSAPDRVIDILYNTHMHTLILLISRPLGTSTISQVNSVEFWPLDDNYMLKDKIGVPPFTFPIDTNITELHMHPVSNILYATGNQVWMSEDGGNLFYCLHRLPLGVILSAHPWQDGSMLFDTLGTHQIFSNTGIFRAVAFVRPVSPTSECCFYHLRESKVGDLICLSTNSWPIMGHLQPFNITTNMRSFERPVHHTLFVLYTLPLKASLFEYDHSSSYPCQGNFDYTEMDVGMEIFSQPEGRAVIRSVESATHRHPRLCKEIQVTLKQYFTRVQSAALAYSVGITDSGNKTVIIQGQDWSVSDINRTLVMPSGLSFLLVSLISSNLVKGQGVVSLHSVLTAQAEEWFLVDLGIHKTALVSPLQTSHHVKREAECSIFFTRQNQKPKPGETNVPMNLYTTFELDYNDRLAFPVYQYIKFGLYQKKEQVNRFSLSNPWLFRLTSHPIYPPYLDERIIHQVNIDAVRFTKGVAVIRIIAPETSLLCDVTALIITIYTGCPCNKQLRFNYPYGLLPSHLLPRAKLDNNIKEYVYELPYNYRPPSVLGLEIPLSSNVYNVNHTQPLRRTYWTRVAGKFK